MEWLKETFFEDPTTVYIVLAMAEAVLAFTWFRRREAKWAWRLLIPLMLAGVVCLVAWLAVTDREQIQANAQQLARDVERGNVEHAFSYLSEKFDSRLGELRITRSQSLEAAKFFLKTNPIRKITMIGSPEVKVTDDQAGMKVATIIEFSGGQMKDAKIAYTWNVHWVKIAGQWKIDGAEARPGLDIQGNS